MTAKKLDGFKVAGVIFAAAIVQPLTALFLMAALPRLAVVGLPAQRPGYTACLGFVFFAGPVVRWLRGSNNQADVYK